jgi:DNA-binding PucR family transcriptional regulator
MAGAKKYARDRRLAPPRAVVLKLRCHCFSPLMLPRLIAGLFG